MRLFLNHALSDAGRITPLKVQLEKAGYRFTSKPDDCDFVVSFFSEQYLADTDCALKLTQAACSLRTAFILVELDKGLQLPAELEMLAAKHGLVEPGQLIGNIKQRIAEPKRSFIDHPITQKYVFKPFEADNSRDADYAFISYAHADAQVIYDLIKPIYEQGWKIWYDEGIKISNSYISDIASAIKNCKVFLLFVTERSINRPFVMNFERAYAKKLNKPIVLVRMHDFDSCLPEELIGLELIAPGDISEQLGRWLKKQKERDAVPPVDKLGVLYDIAQISEMEDYEFKVRGGGIILSKYKAESPGDNTDNWAYYLGNGCFQDYNEGENETDIKIPDIHCGLPVQSLWGTFEGLTHIESVSIPGSVQTIGSDAFKDCMNLVSVQLHEGLAEIGYRAFYYCNSLEKIEIPNSVKSIGRQAFQSCESLETATIPRSVTQIADNAFDFCDCLTIRCYKDSAAHQFAEEYNFDYELLEDTGNDEGNKPLSAAFIYDESDDEITKLANELLGEGYRIITCPSAFSLKRALESSEVAVIFISVKTIKAIERLGLEPLSAKRVLPIWDSKTMAAVQSSSISSLSLVEGIFRGEGFGGILRKALQDLACYENPFRDYVIDTTADTITVERYLGREPNISIPDYCFYPPKRVDSIAEGAFWGNLNLETVVLPSSMTEIGDNAFAECDNLRAVSLGRGLTGIGDGAFAHCSSLSNIEFPESIKSIGEVCFNGCNSLRKISLPGSLIKIANNGFENCDSLERVVLGSGIREIGDFAFSCCWELKYIAIPSSVQLIGDNAFYCCQNLTIYAPVDSIAWKYAIKNNLRYADIRRFLP